MADLAHCEIAGAVIVRPHRGAPLPLAAPGRPSDDETPAPIG